MTLSVEALESRHLLAGTPELILLDTETDSFPADFVQLDDIVLFVAEDENRGRELWRTDGTIAGTDLVRDILPGTESSDPQSLVKVNGRVFFSATDGENGRELWMSDGTQAGTVLVKDIQTSNANPYAYDLSSNPNYLADVDGILFFAADDGVNGTELWKSDGTAGGTVMVRDIAPGSTQSQYYGNYPYSSFPSRMTNVNGTVFFAAEDGSSGQELWKSDGTQAGTVLIRDINPGEGYQYPYGDGSLQSFPNELTNVDGLLFFTATDDNGEELWVSDGTLAGTVMVGDLFPGSFTDEYGTYPYSSYPRNLTAVDGTLFFHAVSPSTGAELWKISDTTGGIELVKDIVPGDQGSAYDTFSVESDGRLFFTADDVDNGTELWVTDGTDAGTFLVKDINPGPSSSAPQGLVDVGGLVFFSATTDDAGRELWQSNGTDAGTEMVADIREGDPDSEPSELFNFDGNVLFSADDGGTGFQLWTVAAETVLQAELTIYVDGSQVTIPADIGVAQDGGALAQVTTDSNGNLVVSPIDDEPLEMNTLDDFFATWRTNAGVAGDNTDATFSATELMGNVADNANLVHMYVNGSVSTEFEEHVFRNGDEIVLVFGANPVVSLQTNFGPIIVELFESATPGTVDNFLNYVNDGDYNNSFFHRSVRNFVIQAGGFTTPSSRFGSSSQFSGVPNDAPLQNEPGISNLRGTVAMAKLGGDPNSATSQFFVNLGDNSDLDLPENNSFTVFGQVLDMSTVDEIAALNIDFSNPPPFDELPLSDSGELAVIEAIDGVGTVSGTKFEDLNLDGIRDAGEVGLAGVTIFADANGDGLLNSDEISTVTNSLGQYRLEVAGGSYTIIPAVSPDKIQTLPALSEGYSLDVEIGRDLSDIDFAEATLPPPTLVDLVAATDSGLEDDDDVTNLDNGSVDAALQFLLTGVVNTAEVRLFANNVLIGSAVASSNEVVVTTDGSTTLPEGTLEITAVQIFDGVQSAATSPLSVVIDTQPPADITSAAPEVADIEQPFVFNVESPAEASGDAFYSLRNEPDGMIIDQDGLIRWTAEADQARPQDFSIVLSDLAGNEVEQFVELTVLGEIPALPDSYSTDEDLPLTVDAVTGLLANDGDDLSVTLTASLVDDAENGTVTVNTDGSFVYTPDGDFFGTDRFSYTATDGQVQANIARVTVTVNPVNDAPSGVDDAYGTDEDQILTVPAGQGVLDNDLDPDGDALSVSLVSDVTNGTLNLSLDGSFTYLPNTDFFGIDSFTYEISDGSETSNEVTVMLTVDEVDDPPEAFSDSYVANEDATLQLDAENGVLRNDVDTDSDGLTAQLAVDAAHGTVTLNSDGSFSYTPDDNFFGNDTFRYTVSDGTTSTGETIVTILVNGLPDAPTAEDDQFVAESNSGATSFDVLENDSSDPDGPQTLTLVEVTTGSEGGMVSIVGDSVEYTPPQGFVGTDTFTYTIEDTDGLMDTAMVTVDVTDTTPGTIAGNVYLDMNADGRRNAGEPGVPGALITLKRSDSTADALIWTAITDKNGRYRFTGLAAGNYELLESQPEVLADADDQSSAPQADIANDQITNIVLSSGQEIDDNNFGEAQIRAKYLSIAWFFASSIRSDNMFVETVAQGEELAGKIELANSIRSGRTELPDDLNRPPIAIVDSYETLAGSALDVSSADGVLRNDVDPNGDSITATLVDGPSNGTITFNDDGSFQYTPDAGFEGTDDFSYTADDAAGSSNATRVTIVVRETSNQFSVAENSDADTSVGTVTASAELSDPIFQIQQSGLAEELYLLPDDHTVGQADAPIVLIEYLDFQCPICRTYHPIIQDLEDDFEDSLLVVSRHLPLTSIHFNAFEAAQAAEAAGRQGFFDEMGDLLFENQNEWAAASDPQSFFDSYATSLGLDMVQFADDKNDPEIAARINRDLDAAGELGANATPTFYLNGNMLEDLPDDLDEFSAVIEEELDDFDEPFKVHRTTGELLLAGGRSLNFESDSTLELMVRVTGANGQTEIEDVVVQVLDVNEAPLAFADTYQTNLDVIAVGVEDGLLENDSDEDQDLLTAILVDDALNGVVTLADNGSFTYLADPGFLGTDTFTYQANDGELNSNIATVSITVESDEGEGEDDDELLADLALASEEDWL